MFSAEKNEGEEIVDNGKTEQLFSHQVFEKKDIFVSYEKYAYLEYLLFLSFIRQSNDFNKKYNKKFAEMSRKNYYFLKSIVAFFCSKYVSKFFP